MNKVYKGSPPIYKNRVAQARHATLDPKKERKTDLSVTFIKQINKSNS